MVRIAIVDDSRLARTFTATVLAKGGHEPVEVDPVSIFEVLKVLREAPPKVMVMDFLMPGCPGNSLVRACREDPVLQEVRILVCTAHRDDEVQERMERMGVMGYLHKPFEPQALLDAVASLLAREA